MSSGAIDCHTIQFDLTVARSVRVANLDRMDLQGRTISSSICVRPMESRLWWE
jgi:hypothetical protein